MVDKGDYRHFMAKEIHEQPEVIGHTLAHYIDMASERVRDTGATLPFDFNDIQRVSHRRLRHCLVMPAMSANTGSSASRASRSKSMLPANSAIAIRRCRRAASAFVISQSGETADTLAALRDAKEQGCRRSRSLNVPTVPSPAKPISCCRRLAGPEIGVASTKAFTCQFAVLAEPRNRRRQGARRPH